MLLTNFIVIECGIPRLHECGIESSWLVAVGFSLLYKVAELHKAFKLHRMNAIQFMLITHMHLMVVFLLPIQPSTMPPLRSVCQA